jgi:hypothetical protein
MFRDGERGHFRCLLVQAILYHVQGVPQKDEEERKAGFRLCSRVPEMLLDLG